MAHVEIGGAVLAGAAVHVLRCIGLPVSVGTIADAMRPLIVCRDQQAGRDVSPQADLQRFQIGNSSVVKSVAGAEKERKRENDGSRQRQ